jgi:O-antigen/teichoic acid export membrane protein
MWRKRLFATTSGALVSKGATVLTALLLFRLVPASDLGRYTAALTLVGFCAILGNAGLNQLTTREVARLGGQEGRAWFGALLPLRLLLALGAYALLVLVALVVPGLVDARLTLIAGLLLLPDTLAAAFSSAITGQGRAALASWLDALRNLIGLAATLALVFFWHVGVLALAWLLVGLAVWALVVNGALVGWHLLPRLKTHLEAFRREARLRGLKTGSSAAGDGAWRLKSRPGACGHKTRLRGLGRMVACLGRGVRVGGLGGGTPLGAVLTARRWRSALAAALPLGLGALAATLYFRVDTLFLSAARGGRDVAYYSAPYQIVESFWLISTSWNAVALPMLAKRYDARLVERSIALLVSIGLPASLFISIRAEDVARLVFGAGYLPAALPLRLVIWVVPILFCYVPIVTALFVYDRQGQVLYVLLANLGLVMVLDTLLIPPFGVLGASIATLIVEAGALVGYLWLARRARLGIRWARALVRPVLISAPIAGALLVGQGLPFWLVLILTGVLWLVGFAAVGGVFAVPATRWRIVARKSVRAGAAPCPTSAGWKPAVQAGAAPSHIPAGWKPAVQVGAAPSHTPAGWKPAVQAAYDNLSESPQVQEARRLRRKKKGEEEVPVL